MPRIIDGFTFYNEEGILLLRLMELYDTVDYFILVESTVTHAGNPKKLYYNDIIKEKSIFKKYLDKIVHVIVDDMPEGDDKVWLRENYQRDCIINGIKSVNPQKDDLIFVSDVDEIFDKNVVNMLKNNINLIKKDIHLNMYMYYYNINTLNSKKWIQPYCIKYGDINKNLNYYRLANGSILNNDKCGWHLSYFGDVEFIYNKLSEFSHQEFNNEIYNKKENIEKCIKTGKNLFDDKMLEYVELNEKSYIPYKWNAYKQLIDLK